jgi:Phosphatidylinositol N-acetylglucosaminyltransferase
VPLRFSKASTVVFFSRRSQTRFLLNSSGISLVSMLLRIFWAESTTPANETAISWLSSGDLTIEGEEVGSSRSGFEAAVWVSACRHQIWPCRVKTSKASRHSHLSRKIPFNNFHLLLQLHESASDTFSPLDRSPSRPTPAPPYIGTTLSPSLSPRVQSRLRTVKFAILIYLTLLGLSPILKSLTTSSDSIWALTTWLLIINIFFVDYGGLYTPPKAQLRRSHDVKRLRNGSSIDASALVPPHAAMSGRCLDYLCQ